MKIFPTKLFRCLHKKNFCCFICRIKEIRRIENEKKMLTLAFDFPVVAALEVSAVAAAAPLVFLLIILFGELLRCKNGLFCTVPPVLGAAFSRFFSGEAEEAGAACWAGVCKYRGAF